ncbi:MAG: RloB family protein [Vicingaceae bacterium]|nr:RloB family protein [Vicingaceae bacterium]
MRNNISIGLKGSKAFAFVVDGNTEVWYLQMLKRNERKLNINIEPKLPSKKSIPEQYKMVEQLAEDYTKVFWIVDYDVIIKETLESKKGTETSEQLFIRLKEKVEKNENVIVVINNPCIEFWFLLHFEKTTKFFTNCNLAEKQLKKYLKDYVKTRKYFTKQDNDIYLRLKENLNEAKKNSTGLKFDKTNTNKAICEMNLLFKIPEIDKVIDPK